MLLSLLSFLNENKSANMSYLSRGVDVKVNTTAGYAGNTALGNTVPTVCREVLALLEQGDQSVFLVLIGC